MKKIVLLPLLLISFSLTACDLNNQVKGYASVETQSMCNISEKDVQNLNDEDLTTYAICLVQNDLPDQLDELYTSYNKQDDSTYLSLKLIANTLKNSSATYEDYRKAKEEVSKLSASSEEGKIRIDNLMSKVYSPMQKVEQAKLQEEKAKFEKELQESRNKFAEKYYNPEIGMTAEKVEKSRWGKPEKINKTTTEYGVHEQWVYLGDRYLYLEDGIVTAIQESR